MELFIKPTKQNDDINMLDLEDTIQIMSSSVDRSEAMDGLLKKTFRMDQW